MSACGQTRPLGEVVEILDHRRVPVSAKQRSARLGSVPYYGATGQVGWIDEPLFDEELLLLGEDGVQFFDREKPKAYIVQGPSWVNNHAHVLRVGPYADALFLKHQLDVFDYSGYAGGTTRLKLTKSAMCRIPVWLPSVSEQRRIVDELERRLSSISAGTAYLHRAINVATRAEEAVVLAGVTGRLVKSERAVESAAAHLQSVLGTKPDQVMDLDGLPLVPDHWEWVHLGSVAAVVGGATKDSKRQDDPAFVQVPYLRVANVQRGYLSLDEVARIRVPRAKADALALQPGDVLFNEGGDRDKLGRGWVWEGQIHGCIHQNHVFRARLVPGAIDSRFLSWYGNFAARGWFEAHGKQTTNLASINLSTLKTLPVPVPPPDEQLAIVDDVDRRLSLLRAARASAERSMSTSRALRSAVVSQALLLPGGAGIRDSEGPS